MQQQFREVEQVATASHEMSSTAQDVARSAAQAADAARDADQATREGLAVIDQSAVADDISRNVASIRDVTESLSGQADESAQVSQQLNQLANHQQSLMGYFKV
jgi:methyl-accepting chemotaxis protein